MKKIFPVIHVETKNQTFKNIEVVIEAKSDGVFLISHNKIKYKNLLLLAKEIKEKYPNLWIGINFLDINIVDFFHLTNKYPNFINSCCNAIWCDNSERGLDEKKANKISELWKNSKFKGDFFGGVAFKYQKQPNSLEEAVNSSLNNMSVITTTGDSTGNSPIPYKIKKMASFIEGQTKFAIASGIDISNLNEYIEYVDYFLVSTGISENHSYLDLKKTKELSSKIHKENKMKIRYIKDFPKEGIVFKDITPLLADHKEFDKLMNSLVKRYESYNLDYIAGLDARGFLFGMVLADRLGIGFIPVRKKGKLPYKTVSETYDLEYGTDTVEIHIDAAKKGDKVLLIDDLLATGGTASAAIKLFRQLEIEPIEFCFILELDDLKGRKKLDIPVFSVERY